MKKQVVVLGAGISGLSLAWYLKKYCPNLSIKILDKSPRAGGVIGSYSEGNLILDQGPKTFKSSSGKALMQLIEEVGVQGKIIQASEKAKLRYLYTEGRLQPLPSDFKSLFKTSLTRKALPGLFKELFIRKSSYPDETIGAFARRRFGNYIADVFFDPFVLGVCGADMHKLSIEACFPKLKALEESYSSVIRGMILKKKKQKKNSSLFNLKGGLSTLTDAISEQLKEELFCNEEIKEIKSSNEGVEIYTSQGMIYADRVFSTLPVAAMKNIKMPKNLHQHAFFEEVGSISLTSVSLAYKEDVLLSKGFGYLVPSKEKDSILGVIFDSEIFPSLDDSSYKTKLTVMIGNGNEKNSDENILEKALEALHRHLKIVKRPAVQKVFRYPNALVQYPLYHKSRLDNVNRFIQEHVPSIILAGSYLHQPGVNYCIQTSKELAKQFQERL